SAVLQSCRSRRQTGLSRRCRLYRQDTAGQSYGESRAGLSHHRYARERPLAGHRIRDRFYAAAQFAILDEHPDDRFQVKGKVREDLAKRVVHDPEHKHDRRVRTLLTAGRRRRARQGSVRGLSLLFGRYCSKPKGKKESAPFASSGVCRSAVSDRKDVSYRQSSRGGLFRSKRRFLKKL